MSAYLFVHFKEKTTPDAEQVYFGISRDGFHWTDLNSEQPVLWTYVGTHGVRDFTIVRHPLTGRCYIIATDLSIAYQSRHLRPGFWEKIGRIGSSSLVVWESDDLVHWTESRLLNLTDPTGQRFGCAWAPDAIWDKNTNSFLLHWTSPDASDNFGKKRIWYTHTSDFVHIDTPKVLHEEPTKDIIDSAIYEDHGVYYMFAKGGEPASVHMYQADSIEGPYTRMSSFDDSETGRSICEKPYEAPTAVLMEDGRWCLFLDYFGARGTEQGYIPFLSNDMASGIFTRSEADFSFPYGYKHGTILKITDEEYDRLAAFDWSDKGYGPNAF